MKRFGFIASLFMAGSLAFAAPVLAAAPTNDTYADRTVIGSLPFADSVDTTEATTDADDTVPGCVPPAADASVWYELTATSDATIEINTKASTYSAGITVATGSPGNFSLVTCGPTSLTFEASAGIPYAILVFDHQADGGGNGGTLEITVEEVAPPPPAPVVDVTVNPVGSFNAKTGSATITGTVTCIGLADGANIDVQLRQTVGRFVITGFGSVQSPCDGTVRSWSAEVVPDNGLFKGGRAASVTSAFAFGPGGFGTDSEERSVTLRR